MTRIIAVAMAVAISGCATVQREAAWRERVSGHVYQQPLDAVWPQVRSLVIEQGYSFKEADGQFVLVTDWKEEAQGSKSHTNWTRILAQGVRMGDSRCLVRFVRHTSVASTMGPDAQQKMLEANFGRDRVGRRQEVDGQFTSGPHPNSAQELPVQASELFQKRTGTASASRHTEMEWRLIARMDPAAAEAIARETKHPAP
jgi:hypothetical protein